MKYDFVIVDELNFPAMFRILYANMSAIMPTGNSYDEDFAMWKTYAVPAIQEKNRKVVYFYAEGNLAGYFQYSLNQESDSLFMEDMQIQREHQGKGLFSVFYKWFVRQLPNGIQAVEAHAGKTNNKSQAVLEHLGLHKVGENCTGKSYHYRGDYSSILGKYGLK